MDFMRSFILFSMPDLMRAISAPYMSSWIPIHVNGTSPIYIIHTLQEVPVKVDVQVRVVYLGEEYIFPGMGSSQRDDDVDTEFGGVVYVYNELYVAVYVPVYKPTGPAYTAKGRLISTGGSSYSGRFVGSFTSGHVRVRAWKLSDWPTPDFTSENVISISKGSPYKEIPHGMAAHPDFVVVQLKLSDGYISEAQGGVQYSSDHGTWNLQNNACGTVFGADDSSVYLWSARGTDDYVSCANDGWGSASFKYKSASIIIRAWFLDNSDVVYREEFYVNQFDTPLLSAHPKSTYDLIDRCIVHVQVKDVESPYHQTFDGIGSAMLGYSTDLFGGVIFGYTDQDIYLWTPKVSTGHLIYIGGVWGDGIHTKEVRKANISVTLITTGNSGSTNSTSSVLKRCPVPPSVSNSDMLVNGTHALYSCVHGYFSKNSTRFLACENGSWSSSDVECLEQTCEVDGTSTHGTGDNHQVTNPTQNGYEHQLTISRIDRKNTSSYRRSLISVYDSRQSSIVIGSVSVFIMSVALTALVLADCVKLKN